MYTFKIHRIALMMFTCACVLLASTLPACEHAVQSDDSDSDNGDSDTDTDADSDNDFDTDVDTDTDTVTDSDGNWLFYEDFDAYDVGELISEVGGSAWEVWPGGEEASVTEQQFNSSPNSLQIDTGNDVVLLFYFDGGNYEIDLDMLVAENKSAYYSFLSSYGQQEEYSWAFEVFFYPGGVGTLYIQQNIYPFKFDDSDWFSISHRIDLENDFASLSIDNNFVHEWQYSPPGAGGGSLDGINFYGHSDPPGCRSWIDDVRVTYAD